jgi:hypothetical protein
VMALSVVGNGICSKNGLARNLMEQLVFRVTHHDSYGSKLLSECRGCGRVAQRSCCVDSFFSD